MKVVSKIYEVVENRNKCVAEVVEGCGCGFDFLIRIVPEYKYNIRIFCKCLKICGVSNFSTDIEKANADIENCIDRGYVIGNENIAIVVDNVIE